MPCDRSYLHYRQCQYPDPMALVWKFGASILAVTAVGLFLSYRLSGDNLATWIVGYTFSNWRHVLLVGYWIMLLSGSVSVYFHLSTNYARSGAKFILNLKRKYYHLLVTLMFVPGLLWQASSNLQQLIGEFIYHLELS